MSIVDDDVAAAEQAAPGTFENPADETVFGQPVVVVAARGSFGIVRGIAVTYGFYVDATLAALKVEVAKHVGTLTEGVYWSQHVYEGLPWYVAHDRELRDRSNGIWLWRWKPPSDDKYTAKFQEWNHRLDYGQKQWTACTEPEPERLADLPKGL